MPASSRKTKSKSGTVTSQPKSITALSAKYDWWWRRIVFAQFVEPADGPVQTKYEYQTVRIAADSPYRFLALDGEFNRWKRQTERAAWRYELFRRINDYNVYPSFPEIDGLLESLVLGTFSEKHNPVARRYFPPTDELPWSDPLPPFQIDLTKDEEALKHWFMLWICEQRQKRGIQFDTMALRKIEKENGEIQFKREIIDLSGKPNSKKKSKNRGNQNKSPSWRPIELMDLSNDRKLLENERKIVEKYRREALKYSELFQNNLKCWHDQNSKFSSEHVGKCTLNIFLEENFQKHLEKVRESKHSGSE